MTRLLMMAAGMMLALSAAVHLAADPPAGEKKKAENPPAGQTPPPVGAAQPEAKPGDKPARPDPPPKEEPKPASDEPPSDHMKTADEVMEMLRKQKPTNEPIVPSSLRDQPAAGSAGGRHLLPEGTRVSRKAGRIVHEGDGWVFVQESDHPDHPEPRLRLLPCQHLEQMVRETQSAAADIVYVVSGEVTVYEGENYLLVRLAARRTSLGNLTP